jgi:polar amino acid transport system substrate-binding protein
MRKPQIRNILSSIIVIVLPACLGCPLFAPPLPNLGGREVTVAVENAYPPFSQINPETGQPEGWDYDAIDQIARRLNFRPVYVQVPFADTIAGVAAGTYDMSGNGIAITYANSQIVDYSQQYAIVRQRVAVRAGESRFRTFVELKAASTLIIGAELGSSNFDAAVGYFGADRVATFAGFEETVQALLDGTVDAVVLDDISYWTRSRVTPELSRLPGVLYAQPLGFIFPKGSELTGPISQAIIAMEADGSLSLINEKWLPISD